MSDNIINFEDEIFKKYKCQILICPACQDQTSFLPIVQKNNIGIYISHLQCVGPYCCQSEDGTVYEIASGYFVEA